MDDVTKNIELLDKFMANERKSKLWTTVNIGIFCLLGLSIFFLAYQLNKSNAKYKIINEQLKKTQDSLKIALGLLDDYNVSLKQDSISLTNRVGNYDSLKNVLDTVLILLKETKSGGEKNIKVSENIKNIITAEKPTGSGNTVYTVFLQCMPGFEKMMPGMVKDLKERKYKVPKWETVKDITFDPVIKYFYQADAEEAKKIAALINKSNDFFQKNPVKVQKLNLKSQQRQIEVWIGEYRRKDIQQLIQQTAPEQKKS
jgi:hypothetical protein